MGESLFSVNDLLRRKFQTSLSILSLTMCVGATVFLLLFADRVGFGISLRVEGSLTAGLSSIFSNFLIFIAVLIFVAGAVVASFTTFVMMAQRARDIGLIRAAGCPNDVVFGYFFNELLIITFVSCVLGAGVGIVADFASVKLLGVLGLQASQKTPNFWLVPLVFVLFFVFALLFGAKPILDTTRVDPAKAVSPIHYAGLVKESASRVIPGSNFAMRMAVRNLSRHKSVTFRAVLCLAIIFVLLTVAVAGGKIAEQTTEAWVKRATGSNIVVMGHEEICNQYALLLSSFSGSGKIEAFNYTDPKYAVPPSLVEQARSVSGIIRVDARLVVMGDATEVSGYVADDENKTLVSVGDNRRGESLMVGVDPASVVGDWFMQGKFLQANRTDGAVVGDSIALTMFSQPLVQGISFANSSFHVVGVVVDPINNGKVTYLDIKALQKLTGSADPNVVLVQIDSGANRSEVLNRLSAMAKTFNMNFEVVDLEQVLRQNIDFLGYVWSTITLIPLLTLVAGALCLVGYVALTIYEQRQEFGILRAVGAKSRTVLAIMSGQNIIISLSSFGAGVAVGLMLSLLLLIQEPVITVYGAMGIAVELLAILFAVFAFSLFPTVRFARKPVLEIIREP